MMVLCVTSARCFVSYGGVGDAVGILVLARSGAGQLGKEQLLEALRFGADNVFRSKDTSITDADIDAIMEQGKVCASSPFVCVG